MSVTRYHFDRPARAALLDELIAAGLPATTLVEMDDTQCWVTCDESQYATVAQVVAAHDAAAIDAAAAQAIADDNDDRRNRAALFQQLKQDYALLVDANQNITQAQYRAILARALRLLWVFVQIAQRRGL